MHPEKVTGAHAAREQGLGLVNGWTVAVAVGALGLTGALALAAADTFHGRTIAQPAAASPDQAAASPSDDGLAPQAPVEGTFGGGAQAPVVVSGGS